MTRTRITRRQALASGGLLLGGASLLRANESPFRIGIAETPITPSWPTRLWGYDRFTGGLSTGVLDDIYAKGLLIDAGQVGFLLITVDLGAIGLDLSRRIARAIRERTGIPEDAIAIQCTHDHSSPAALGIPMTAADTRFQDLLAEHLVSLAEQAQKNRRAAVLEFAQTSSFIGLNRRVGNRENTWDKDSGPIDPTLSLLLVRSQEGKLLGALVNYAAHPVTLRADNYKISADYPGVLYRRLGAELACPVLYMQGCCGDVIPKVFGTSKEMESFGSRMAEEALRAVPFAARVSGDTAGFRARRVTLNFVAPYTLAEFRTKAAELENASTVPREWAKVYLQYLEHGGAPQQAHETMVETFRAGDLHFALLPGEVLHLTALRIRSHFPGMKLLLGSYTNDTSTGYLPPALEFPKGGYEVNSAWQLYGVLKTTPEMEAAVRAAAIDLLRATAGPAAR